MAKPERCDRCNEKPSWPRGLDPCVACGKWVCNDCDAGSDWRNPNTGQTGYACRACTSLVTNTTGVLPNVAIGSLEYVDKVLLPKIRLLINDDVRRLVDELADRLGARIEDLEPLVSASASRIVAAAISKLREDLAEAAPGVVAAAGVELDRIVQRNIDYALEGLRSSLRETALSLSEGPGAEAIDTIRSTVREVREIVDSLHAVAPQFQALIDTYIEDKQQDRLHDWNVVFRNSTIGLLIASLVFALDYEAGKAFDPVLGVRLVWLALTVPMVLTIARGLYLGFRAVRGTALQDPVARALKQKAASPGFFVGRVLSVLVLVAGNLLLLFLH